MSTTVDERVVSMQFDNSDFEKNVKTSMSTLDKFKRKLKFDDCADSFNNLERSSNKVKFQGLNDGIDSLSVKINGWSVVAATAISRVVNHAIDAGAKIVKALSIDQISAGWSKYESITEATQTLMAALKEDENSVAYGLDDEGRKMERVNDILSRLNWYSDETSHSLEGLVSTISKFTAAGLNLEDSEGAMEGLANMTSLAGGNAETATRVMYQLSQALGKGKIQTQDWMSVETANVATEETKLAFLEAAVAEGKLIKEGNKYYTVLGDEEDALEGVNSQLKTYRNGVISAGETTKEAEKGMEVTTANFRETLQKGWFTTDVLLTGAKTFGDYTKELSKITKETGERILTMDWNKRVTKYYKALAEANEETRLEVIEDLVKDLGIEAEQAEEYLNKLASSEYEIGRRAFMAAQETKTFSEVISATKDAASTKWMNTFKTIIGDYMEARELFSDMAERAYNTFVTPAASITDIFQIWKDLGGRDLIFGLEIKGDPSAYENLLAAFESLFSFDEDGAFMNGFLNFYESIHGEFDLAEEDATRFDMLISDLGNRLYKISEKIRDWTAKLIPSEETKDRWSNIFQSVLAGFHSVVAIIKDIRRITEPIRDLFKEVLNRLFIAAGDGDSLLVRFDKWLSTSEKLESIVAKLQSGIRKVTDFVLKLIDGLIDGDISDVIADIGNWVSNINLEKIGETLKTIAGFVYILGKNLIDKIKQIDFKKFGENIKKIVTTVKDGFMKILTDHNIDIMQLIFDIIDTMFNVLSFGLKILKKILPLINRVIDSLTELGKDLSEAGAGDVIFNFFKLVINILRVGLTYINKWLEEANEKFGNVEDAIAAFEKKIQKIKRKIKNVFSWLKGDFLPEVEEKILKFVGIFNMLAPAITMLVGAIAAVNFGHAIKVFSREMGDFFGLYRSATARAIRNIALMIVAIVAAQLIMIYAIKEMNEIGWDNVLKGAVILSAFILILGSIIAYLISLTKKGFGDKEYKELKGLSNNLREVTYLVLTVAGAMMAMVGALKIIDGLEHPWQSFFVLAGMFALLEIVLLTLQRMTKTVRGNLLVGEFTKFLLGLAVIVAALAGVLILIEKNLEDIWHAFGVLAALAIVIVAMMGLVSLLAVALKKTFRDVSELERFRSIVAMFSHFMLYFAVSIGILAGVLILIGKNLEDIWYAFGVFAALTGVMAAMAVLVIFMSRFGGPDSEKALKGFSIYMITFSIAMSILAGVLAFIERNLEDIWHAFGVLAALAGIMIAFIGLTEVIFMLTKVNPKDALGALSGYMIAFTTAMAGLAGVLKLIKTIDDPWGAVGVLAVLGLILVAAVGSMILFSKLAGGGTELLKIVGSLGLFLIAFVGCLYAMVTMLTVVNAISDPWKAVGIVAVLGLLLGVVVGIVGLAAGQSGKWNRVVAMVGIIAAVTAAMWALAELVKMLSGVESSLLPGLGALVVMAAILGVLTAVVVSLGKGKKNYKGIFTTLAVMGAITLALVSIAYALKMLDGVKLDTKTLIVLAGAMLLIGAMTIVLGIVGLAAGQSGKWNRLVAMVGIIAAVTAAMWALAELVKMLSGVGNGLKPAVLALVSMSVVLGILLGVVDMMSKGKKNYKGIFTTLAVMGAITLALVSIAYALKMLDGVKLDTKTLLVLAGAMLLIGAMTIVLGSFTKLSLIGAAAFAIMAGAMILVAYALVVTAHGIELLAAQMENFKMIMQTLGEVLAEHWATILKWIGIVALAAVALVLLGAALITVGVGLLFAGIGALLFGAGIYLAAQGIALLSEYTERIGPIIEAFIAGLLKGLTMILSWILLNIPLIEAVLIELANMGVRVLVGAFIELLDILDEKAPEIGEKVLGIIIKILQVINEHVEEVTYEATKLAFGVAIGMIEGLTEKLPDLLEAGAKFIIAFIGGLGDTLSAHADEAAEAVEKLLTGLVRIVLAFLGIRGEAADNLAGTLGKFLANPIGQLIKWFASLWTTIKGKFSEGKTKIKERLSDLWTDIKKKPREWIDNFKQFGKDILKGLIDGFKELKQKVVDTVEGIGDKIKGGFKKLFGIESPSRVFRQYGQYIDEGLILGLNDYADKAGEAAGEMGDGVTDAVTEAISRAYDLLENGVDADPTIRPILDLSNIQNGIGLMNGMLDGDYSVGATARYAQAAADSEYNAARAAAYSDAASSTTNNTDQSITNTFNISGDNPREIAEEVSRIIQQQIGRRNTVWA